MNENLTHLRSVMKDIGSISCNGCDKNVEINKLISLIDSPQDFEKDEYVEGVRGPAP